MTASDSPPPTYSLTKGEIIGSLAIAGLGFFVDIFDSVIFIIIRVPSLTSLGVPHEQLLPTGVLLLNLQMAGMVLGGLIWGVIGDKKGRRTALFGSIIVYSVANLLNACVNSVPAYACARTLAGIGLAGEVGAAMVIAAEVMPAKYRSYGTSAVAGIGVSGAVLASFIGDKISWRAVFVLAGILGLFLLLVRTTMRESPIFLQAQKESVPRGDILHLMEQPKRIWRLIRCACSALPLWFVFGVMVSFAPEVAAGSGANAAAVSVATIAMVYSLGENVGEIGSGILSQLLKSRKLPILIMLSLASVLTLVTLNTSGQTCERLFFPLGICVGYWAVMITTAAEQFGTNLRSTATTLIPNVMRASVIPITLSFSALASVYGAKISAIVVGSVCLIVAAISICMMEETFGKDLNFIER